MLKIAQADTLDGCDRSISDAQVHIAAKLRMLEAVHGKLTRQQPQLGGEKDTNTTLMLAARDLRQKMLLSEAQQHEVRVYHIMDSTELRLNHILIKRQKARPWQQDFSSTGAGLAKNSAKGDQQYSNKVTNKAYNATLYGSLFYTAYGLTATFMQILGLGVNYNVIYPSSQDLLAVEATNTLSWDTSRWSQFTELPILPQDDAGKAAAARQDKELRSLNAWKYYPYPMIVTLHIADANVCPLEITINGLPYDLDAAGISVDITLVTGHPDDKVMHHAIAGLTCKSGRGTTRYIYDSNNYLAEDDWTQLRWSRDKPLVTGMENYAAKVAGNGKQYYERCDFQRFDVLVYVLRKID
ncbi:MAG: hypothetical protein WDW38_006432 [Sanguina aurantia]